MRDGGDPLLPQSGERAASLLTGVVVVLGTLVAGAGLIAPRDLYGDPRVAAIIQGQDAVTLAAMPILVVAVWLARAGSARAYLVWAGLLGYMLYTYTGAALAYDFNRLFPAYIALFSASAFALVLLAGGLDRERLRARFDGAEPRRVVAVFLLVMAFFLGVGEAAQVLEAVRSNEPPMIEGTDAALNFIFALDLGVIVPLSVAGAVWLWRGNSWGYFVSGVMLIKAATMGLALLSMNWFAAREGVPGDGLMPLWAFIAVGGFAGTVWFLRHCRG